MDNLPNDYQPTIKPDTHGMGNFEPVLGRMQVPATPEYPSGQAVTLSLYTVIGGPFVFMLPPAIARQIGQGFIDVAGTADGFILPGSEEWSELKPDDFR